MLICQLFGLEINKLDLGIEIISNHLSVHGDVILLCNSKGQQHCHAALLRVHCMTDQQNKDAKKLSPANYLTGYGLLFKGDV